jgi:PPP family 3-phenylpropionic acid transporter
VTRADRVVAAGYLAYFGAVGVFQPYLPVHLRNIGFGGAAIGALLALWGAMRVPGPLLVATLADARPDRRPLMRALGVVSVLATALLAAAHSVLAVGAALAVLSLCFNGLMPVYDAHALDRLGTHVRRYGAFRLWGSVGFILGASATGAATERAGPGIIRFLLLGLTVLAAAVLFAVPAAPRARAAPLERGAFLAALVQPRVRAYLCACFLHLAGFGAYYGFYTLYLLRSGYSPWTAGVLWSTGVVAEIGLFLAGPRLIGRYPLARLLQVALAAAVLRWLLVAGFPGSLAVQFGAQLLHFAAFALFHSVTVLLGPALLPAGARVRAQALVSSLGWGAGGMAGSLVAGGLWEGAGPRAVFLGAALLGLAALWIAVRSLGGDLSRPRDGRPEADPAPKSGDRPPVTCE